MLEEKTHHFPCCVRSFWIGVGAGRAASGPCVSSAVDIPVLQYSAPARVAEDRAGVGMPSRYLAAVSFLLQPHGSHRLLKNLITVCWDERVAITVKNSGRDRWPVINNNPATGFAALSHGDQRRRKVNGGAEGLRVRRSGAEWLDQHDPEGVRLCAKLRGENSYSECRALRRDVSSGELGRLPLAFPNSAAISYCRTARHLPLDARARRDRE